jgi:hypothetical protein
MRLKTMRRGSRADNTDLSLRRRMKRFSKGTKRRRRKNDSK